VSGLLDRPRPGVGVVVAQFHLLLFGMPQTVVLDVDVRDIGDLNKEMGRSRFLAGRLIQPADCDGETDALVQINRIQLIYEVLP
jgi:hypothetical protein